MKDDIGNVVTTIVGDVLIKEFKEMSIRQRDITLAILISSTEGGLDCHVTTQAILDMFPDTSINILSTKATLHKRVKMIRDAFVDAGRGEESNSMFKRIELRDGSSPRARVVWLMNGRGFANLLVNIPGCSDEVILMKSDVLMAVEYSSKFVDSAVRNGYKQSIIDLISTSPDKFYVSVGDIMSLDDNWTLSSKDSIKDVIRDSDVICDKCHRLGHHSDDCEGIR